MMLWILLINLVVSSIMTGLIWVVQIVHYPLFNKVDTASFPHYQKQHVKRTGNLVAPLMILEIIICVLMVASNDRIDITHIIWLNLAVLLFIWTCTFLLQVPLHNKLLGRFDGMVHRSLVRKNWLRTIAWTVKMLLSLALLEQYYAFE